MATDFLNSVTDHDQRHCLHSRHVCRRCACDNVILGWWGLGAEPLSMGLAVQQPGMSALLG
jgi:hypothetical protein